MSIPAPESVEFWHSALSAFKDWRRRRAALSEVKALGREEADRVLGECGLTCEDFASAMGHRFTSNALLPQAMRSVGVDPDAFEACNVEWSRDLTRTCMLCRHRRRCSDALATQSFAASYRDFCPNQDSISALERHCGVGV